MSDQIGEFEPLNIKNCTFPPVPWNPLMPEQAKWTPDFTTHWNLNYAWSKPTMNSDIKNAKAQGILEVDLLLDDDKGALLMDLIKKALEVLQS